jgi:hypothetical protein
MTKPIVIEPALHCDIDPAWKVVATQVLGKRIVVELWETVQGQNTQHEMEEVALTERNEQRALIATFADTSHLAPDVIKAALLALQTKVDLWRVAREQASPSVPPPDATRPTITVGSDMEPPVTALEQLLNAARHLGIYQRGRYLCEIQEAGPAPKWLHRPPDLPRIAPSSAAHLRELASKVACFDVVNPRTLRSIRDLPPAWLIETLMARKKWCFPPIEGVVNVPTLCPDGSLLVTEGYDPDTGLYLDYNGITFPTIEISPTREQAQQAVETLWEVFQDFPYLDQDTGFSATLAALLSCVCRYSILGRIPMFAVRSSTRASGKGKLIDALSLIALGRTAPRMAQTLDEEEERKRLMTIALAGLPLLHIDNINHPLGSAPLDYALTSPTYGDRLLGKNEEGEAPLNTVFFASGNNMVFHGDTARRVIPIDLDPKDENPELRTDFVHADLEGWVAEHRPRLVHACLTIMRGFFAAQEASKDLPAFGSFEVWSNVIRQAIVWASLPDPCETRTNIEATSDPQYEKHDVLLAIWQQCYNAEPGKPDCALTPRTLASIKQDIDTRATGGLKDNHGRPQPPNEWDEFKQALGALDQRYDGHKLNTDRLGKVFRSMQRRVIKDRRLVADPRKDRSGAVRWKIELFSRPPSAEDAEVGRGCPKRTRARNQNFFHRDNSTKEKKSKNTRESGIGEPLQTSASSADLSGQAPPLCIGDLVWTLSASGDITNPTPYQICAIEAGPDGDCYAIFTETNSGWLLAQCERVPASAVREPGDEDPGEEGGVADDDASVVPF